VLGFSPDGTTQGTVWHTNFFDQAAVRTGLVATLQQGITP